MVPTYHYVNNSFSFVKLNDLFTTSMLTTEAFLNDAAYACLIEPFLDLFQVLFSLLSKQPLFFF